MKRQNNSDEQKRVNAFKYKFNKRINIVSTETEKYNTITAKTMMIIREMVSMIKKKIKHLCKIRKRSKKFHGTEYTTYFVR